MATFNIARAGRNRKGYMEALIRNMYQHSQIVFRQGYGVGDTSAENIIYSFNAVRELYCKVNLIEVYSLEIILESEEREEVLMISDRLGRVLFDMGFQSFVCAVSEEDRYVIVVAINAVSYINGGLFYDNNACLCLVYQSILEIIPINMKMCISENTFFDPKVMDGNYIHGTCI